ncbi:MAG: hypothetical protein RL375_944, partial [Pseudomonadota bacterium]
AHIPHRLVDQDGHTLRLLLPGDRVDLDLGIGADTLAQMGHLAVHPHPASVDPVVGFAARRHAELAQSLGQALTAAFGCLALGHDTRGRTGNRVGFAGLVHARLDIVGAFMVGKVLPTTLAAVTVALVATRAVPVATRRGRAHVAPVVALALVAALIGCIATRATLELAACATAMLLAALELAGAAAFVRPTPVAATATLIVAVATAVTRFTRTRATVEIARRTARATLIVARKVTPATATRIGSTAGAETMVRTRRATRVVAWLITEGRPIAITCTGRRISRVVPGREIAWRARATIVAPVAEPIVRPALLAAIRAAKARAITEGTIRATAVAERAVTLRSIAVRPITLGTVSIATLLRPLVALVERRAAELAAPLALFGTEGRTLLVATVTRALVSATVEAGAIAPRRRAVVRAAVHRTAVVVTARAALLERAITKRAFATWPIAAGTITSRPIAESSRTRASVAGARSEAVVGAEAATRVGPAAATEVATAAAAETAAGTLAAAVTTALVAATALDTCVAIRRTGAFGAITTWAKSTGCATVTSAFAPTGGAVLFFAPGAVFVGLGQGRAVGAAGAHRLAVRVATCRRAGLFLQGDGGHDVMYRPSRASGQKGR